MNVKIEIETYETGPGFADVEKNLVISTHEGDPALMVLEFDGTRFAVGAHEIKKAAASFGM